MTTKINVGLLGAGRIGRVHAEMADVFLEAAEKCAADYQIPTVTQNPQVIFNSDEIDAVIICSSTDTYAQFISDAANAGKHIFCEKPIALDLAVIDRALTDVERSGIKLQLGFNRRFDPEYWEWDPKELAIAVREAATKVLSPYFEVE